MTKIEDYIKYAINEALKSGNDVPIGAVIVKDNKIIATACNEREKANDTTFHAEIIAIKKACNSINNWRLDNCELYVTLEPCPMCAWAILQSRIKTVYFGSYDTQYGAFGSALDLRKLTNSKLKIYGGIMEEECDNIIREFWDNTRKQQNT